MLFFPSLKLVFNLFSLIFLFFLFLHLSFSFFRRSRWRRSRRTSWHFFSIFFLSQVLLNNIFWIIHIFLLPLLEPLTLLHQAWFQFHLFLLFSFFLSFPLNRQPLIILSLINLSLVNLSLVNLCLVILSQIRLSLIDLSQIYLSLIILLLVILWLIILWLISLWLIILCLLIASGLFDILLLLQLHLLKMLLMVR